MSYYGYPCVHFLFWTHDEALAVARKIEVNVSPVAVNGQLLTISCEPDNEEYVRELVRVAEDELNRD